jgi:predicted ATP-binding protein involved in virulence
MLRTLTSDNFPPFGELHIQFPAVEGKPDDLAEVHLLTGVNGTGKTRLLSALAAMMGGPTAIIKRLRGYEKGISILASERLLSAKANAGEWSHFQATSGGFNCTARRDSAVWLAEVPAFAYNGMAYVSDSTVGIMGGVAKPDRAMCLSFSRPDAHSKELLQAITNILSQAVIEGMAKTTGLLSDRATQTLWTIERAISDITGHDFSFKIVTYGAPKLYVSWAKTEMPFDVLPDGLRSIIGWLVDSVAMMDAWLQGKGTVRNSEAVFLLDEVESHLHPTWQRRILPLFQKIFPKAQIFIATHSPFVIASLNHGWIHNFTLDNDGKVTILEPKKANAGDSYISVIENIMGLEEWYDTETETLLTDFRTQRDLAYRGDAVAKEKAFKLAEQISRRSLELRFVMGKELSQMERQLGTHQEK